MYSISNQESSIKCIWKFVSFDKNPLLRGWKLLEFKWGKTAFGEPNNKGQQTISTPTKVLLYKFIFYIHYKLVLLLQWPRVEVTLNAPFPPGPTIVSSYELYRQIYHQWTQRNHLRYVITWVKPCNSLQRVQDRPLNGSFLPSISHLSVYSPP